MIDSRLWAYCVAAVAVGATLWPVLDGNTKDSFPISTYPMFAKHRGKPRIHQLVGVDRSGKRHPLEPRFVGTSEVLQAKVLIRKAARGGKARRRRLCRRAAKAVHQAGLPYHHVELAVARFNPVRYLMVDTTPVSTKRLYRCAVEAP